MGFPTKCAKLPVVVMWVALSKTKLYRQIPDYKPWHRYKHVRLLPLRDILRYNFSRNTYTFTAISGKLHTLISLLSDAHTCAYRTRGGGSFWPLISVTELKIDVTWLNLPCFNVTTWTNITKISNSVTQKLMSSFSDVTWHTGFPWCCANSMFRSNTYRYAVVVPEP